jgi:hypothetical protein
LPSDTSAVDQSIFGSLIASGATRFRATSHRELVDRPLHGR